MYINVFTAVPESYNLSSSEIVSVNGSTQDGHCNGATFVSPGMVECPIPRTNSFLYDGVIPTLTELDGSEWASGLLTLNTSAASTRITFNFPNTPAYGGVESVRVVMFNCPQWGIGTSSINILGTGGSSTDIVIGGNIPAMLTSCDSLVSMCTTNISATLRIISLQFNLADNSDLVYIAEVAFFSNAGRMCEPDAILNPPATPPTPMTTSQVETTSPVVTASPVLATSQVETTSPIVATSQVETTSPIVTTSQVETTSPIVATSQVETTSPIVTTSPSLMTTSSTTSE